jgi:hypothetical protein
MVFFAFNDLKILFQQVIADRKIYYTPLGPGARCGHNIGRRGQRAGDGTSRPDACSIRNPAGQHYTKPYIFGDPVQHRHKLHINISHQ